MSQLTKIDKVRIRLVLAFDRVVLAYLNIFVPPRPNADKILIVKVDAIGDYILHRNFFEYMRQAHPHAEITYVGQAMVSKLAMAYDSPYINKFIWLKRWDFAGSFALRFGTMIALRKAGYGMVLNPTFSRDFHMDDFIVMAAKAPVSIGFEGELYKRKLSAGQKRHNDPYYSKLVQVSDAHFFEFSRLKHFFEVALGRTLPIAKPILPPLVVPPAGLPSAYIVLFPGAAAKHRRWSPANFAAVADALHQEYNLPFVVAGGPDDGPMAEEIIAHAKLAKVHNYAGRTNLLELIALIGKAELLVSNETSAIHIAVGTNVPSVAISNGNHIFRFNFYPEGADAQAITVLPAALQARIDAGDKAGLIRDYGQTSDVPIEGVLVADVLVAAQRLLETRNQSIQYISTESENRI